MVFTATKYRNFVSEVSKSQERLFAQYSGSRNDFDIIIIGSGFGGGVLADDLAERLGDHKRILLLEAGSFLYPTHVYNLCRFPNVAVAKKFACETFRQNCDQNSEHYIHEQPQLNFGGRSIFWSGLIPSIQQWELEFFPEHVRTALESGLLASAGKKMNESVSMGSTAQAIVRKLQQSSLAHDFSIQETPRALHQPYLTAKGEPAHEFFVEPTGVFNTAELLINQVGLTPGIKGPDGPGLHLQLNQFVENIQKRPNGDFDVTVTNTVSGETRKFVAKTVVLSGGSIESPKLLQRSRVYENLPLQVQSMVGVGLTDHPTTHELTTFANHIGDVGIPKNAHAKIIFYSKGRRDAEDQIKYPFNVEMNINHEYWHLRETDPSETNPIQHEGSSRIDIKFSFANPLHDKNGAINAGEYMPEIKFRNLSWAKYLASDRFPKLAGWNKNDAGVWDVLNEITHKIFSQFGIDGNAARPVDEIWYGQRGKGFGLGTVHHATSTLRMPFREAYKESFKENSVVDENLQVVGENGLYVCDMSVMPLSSAANPVRTLVALALRLSEHISARR